MEKSQKMSHEEISRLTSEMLEEFENKNYLAAARMMQQGANVNKANNLGWTVLQRACLDNDINLVKNLLSLGANINQADHFGYGPLHEACFAGHFELVKLLLSLGAVPNSTFFGTNDRYPFDIASYKGHADIAHLIYPYAVWGPCWMAIYEGDIKTIKRCLKYSDFRTLDDSNPYDWTLLSLAAKIGQKVVVKFLIKNGADVHKKNLKGRAALHIAAYHNQSAIVKILIRKGAKVNCKDNNGGTPLHSACRKNSFDAAKALISLGSHINHRENNKNAKNTINSTWSGMTSLHYAVNAGTHDGVVKLIKLLLSRNADVNAKNSVGETPIFFCRYLGRPFALSIAQLLIENGANSSIKAKRKNHTSESFKDIISRRTDAFSKKLFERILELEGMRPSRNKWNSRKIS